MPHDEAIAERALMAPSTSQSPPGYRVDNTRWPLSLHRTPTAMGDSEVTAMITALDELLRRREPVVLVLDLDDQLDLSAGLRRKLAQQLTARHDQFARYCRAISIIARTPNARGVHTALRWLSPAPCIEKTFTSEVEAEQWALAQAREEPADEGRK